MPRYALHRYGVFRYGDYPLVGRKNSMQMNPRLRMRDARSPIWIRTQKEEVLQSVQKIRLRSEKGEWVQAQSIDIEELVNKVRIRAVNGPWVVGIVQRLEEER